MRILLDQMIPRSIARFLIEEEHDAVMVSEIGMSRANDADILEYAVKNNRVLITLDKDFGDWVILPLSSHPGVIRVKVPITTGENIIKVLAGFLRAYCNKEFGNYLVIVSGKRYKWVKTARR